MGRDIKFYGPLLQASFVFKKNYYIQCYISFRCTMIQQFYTFLSVHHDKCTLFFFNFYLRERETEHACKRGRGAEGENLKRVPCSACGARPGAQSHDSGIITWAKIKCRTFNWLSHPGIHNKCTLNPLYLSPTYLLSGNHPFVLYF